MGPAKLEWIGWKHNTSVNSSVQILIVEKMWELLDRESLLPDGCDPKHLLWALHFMKVYPKQSTGCSAVGASAGAVNPKTHRKWIWAFIEAFAELIDEVVSLILIYYGFILLL